MHFFLRIFDEFFSGFRAKFQKIVTCAAFSIKFAKTTQKFAENSEFCEKNSLLLVNYSLLSLARLLRAHLLRPGPPDALAPCEIHEVQLPDAHDVTWVANEDAG